MNGPTKTVGPPWTPLPARKSKGVLEKVLDDADAVIDGNCDFRDLGQFPKSRPLIKTWVKPRADSARTAYLRNRALWPVRKQ